MLQFFRERDRCSESLAQCGLEQYDATIQPRLEPTLDRRFFATHVPTGEYMVAPNAPESRRALRLRFPTGYTLTRCIGSDPDHALSARFLASEIAQGVTK